MKCWKCSKDLDGDSSSCPYCGVNLSRQNPMTEEGKALRKIYDVFGSEEVLENPMYICNGLKDLLPDSEVLCAQIKAAYLVGIGKEYLSQIKMHCKTDDSFHNRIERLLTNDMGFSVELSNKLIRYFDEMVGWGTYSNNDSNKVLEPAKKQEQHLDERQTINMQEIKQAVIPNDSVRVNSPKVFGPSYQVFNMDGELMGRLYVNSNQVLDMNFQPVYILNDNNLINIKSKARFEIEQDGHIIDPLGMKKGYIQNYDHYVMCCVSNSISEEKPKSTHNYESGQVSEAEEIDEHKKIDNVCDETSLVRPKSSFVKKTVILLIIVAALLFVIAFLISSNNNNNAPIILPDTITEGDFVDALYKSGVNLSSEIEEIQDGGVYFYDDSYSGFYIEIKAYTNSKALYEFYQCDSEESAKNLFGKYYEFSEYDAYPFSRRCIRKLGGDKEYVYVDAKYQNKAKQNNRFCPCYATLCRIGKTVIVIGDSGDSSQDEINKFLDVIGLPHT